MNLDGFSCKNNLHTKKYIVKGMAMNESKESIVYFLVKFDKTKYLLNINLNPVKIFNLINVDSFENFEIPNFTPFVFYKPLGYMEAAFFIERGNLNKLRSNMFRISETQTGFEFEYLDFDRFFELDKKDFFGHLEDTVWVPDEAIVHSGRMHADDILSAALLKYVNKNIRIYRTREIPEGFKGVVADVGGGRYDHHNLDKFRKDGNGNQLYLPTGEPEVYAAFGLLAKDILPGIVGAKNYFLLDHQIIRALDSSDNYGTFSDLGYFFSLFNPAWNEDKTYDDGFEDAVKYGLKFITELINKELARQAAQPYVQSKIAKSESEILILEHRVPWQSLAKKSKILFAVYPADDDKSFALQTTPSMNGDARNKVNKIDMPEYWLENPPKGALFVHKSLFFATFDTLENAINAGKEAILNGKDNR